MSRMYLLCPICATAHYHTEPHDQQSLYYQYRFLGSHNRWPTWADAIDHCDSDTQAYWKDYLEKRGIWSEPAHDEPIADPPAESLYCIVDVVSVEKVPCK